MLYIMRHVAIFMQHTAIKCKNAIENSVLSPNMQHTAISFFQCTCPKRKQLSSWKDTYISYLLSSVSVERRACYVEFNSPKSSEFSKIRQKIFLVRENLGEFLANLENFGEFWQIKFYIICPGGTWISQGVQIVTQTRSLMKDNTITAPMCLKSWYKAIKEIKTV